MISADDFVLGDDAFERQLEPLRAGGQTVLSFSVSRFFEDGTEQVHDSPPLVWRRDTLLLSRRSG